MCKSVVKNIATVANPIVAGTTGLLTGGFGGGGSLPGVPTPSYLQQTPVPGMTPQELESLKKIGINADQLASILSGEVGSLQQNQNILKQFSGLYDASGNLDQNALNSLKQRIQGTQQQTDDLNQSALTQLRNSFNQSPLQTTSDQIGLAEANRLNSALRGELEPSNAIVNQEKTEYNKLREAAGQRGIKIEGDDLYTATSQSTAGNQLLNDLRSNFSARRDTERQNIISQSTNANLNRLGFGLNQQNQQYNQAQGLRSDPSSQTMGFMREAQSYSPATLSDQFTNLTNNYAAYASPYANQRTMEYNGAVNNAQYNNQLQNAQITGNYNRDLQQYQNKQNQQNAIFGTIGTIGGALIGGPVGAMVGNQVGQNMGFARAGRSPYTQTNQYGSVSY